MTDGWVPDLTRDFGARLAVVRQHHAWNIRKAAMECGLDPVSWQNWETKGKMPRNYQTVCEQIADRSGCQFIWLMTGRVVAGAGFEPATSGLCAATVNSCHIARVELILAQRKRTSLYRNAFGLIA